MKKLFLTLVLFNCAVSLLMAQETYKTIDKFPDTGQTKDFTATFGEDSDYTINEPEFINNFDGTISDVVTGLMWQRIDGGEMTIENARKYVDSMSLGGYNDWRLPSPMEAFSLLNLNNPNPALDREMFPSTNAQYWWTSAKQYNDENKIWVTNAGGGIGNHLASETVSAGGTKKIHVRAVRQTHDPVLIDQRYSLSGNNTVDHLTQLIWQTLPPMELMTWEEAVQYAEVLDEGNHDDWRLPNIKELQSLNDYSRGSPSCNPTYFPNIKTGNYWSSTSLTNQPQSAWYWDTRFGITTYSEKTTKKNIICVKSVSPSLNEDIIEANIIFHNPIESYLHPNKNLNGLKGSIIGCDGRVYFFNVDVLQADLSCLPSGILILIYEMDSKFYTYKLFKL